MQALVVVAVAVAVVDVTGAVLTDCYFLGQRPEHAESQGQAKAAKAATGSPRLLRHEPSLLVTRCVKLGFQQSNFLVSELARVPVDAKVQHGACVAVQAVNASRRMWQEVMANASLDAGSFMTGAALVLRVFDQEVLSSRLAAPGS